MTITGDCGGLLMLVEVLCSYRAHRHRAYRQQRRMLQWYGHDLDHYPAMWCDVMFGVCCVLCVIGVGLGEHIPRLYLANSKWRKMFYCQLVCGYAS